MVARLRGHPPRPVPVWGYYWAKRSIFGHDVARLFVRNDSGSTNLPPGRDIGAQRFGVTDAEGKWLVQSRIASRSKHGTYAFSPNSSPMPLEIVQGSFEIAAGRATCAASRCADVCSEGTGPADGPRPRHRGRSLQDPGVPQQRKCLLAVLAATSSPKPTLALYLHAVAIDRDGCAKKGADVSELRQRLHVDLSGELELETPSEREAVLRDLERRASELPLAFREDVLPSANFTRRAHAYALYRTPHLLTSTSTCSLRAGLSRSRSLGGTRRKLRRIGGTSPPCTDTS